jgi:DNA-binding transcriptional LysR family regulator
VPWPFSSAISGYRFSIARHARFKLSKAGKGYAATCGRMLTDLEEADTLAAGEGSAPRGTINVTAPVTSGEQVLRPLLDDFLDAYPTMSARLYLLDRPVNLIDEGINVALRIAHLPDSWMVAVRVGEVRRIVVAAPSYLAKHPPIDEPGDLAKQQTIAMNNSGMGSWSFPPADGSTIPRTVQFTPRLLVNSVCAAVASAVEGRGVTRPLSHQVAEHVRDGRLQVALRSDEYAPLPVQYRHAGGPAFCSESVRAFVDLAVPRLRAQFARRTADAGA